MWKTRERVHTHARREKYTRIKIDTRICATANFIFSNRDLRLPQASAPPSPPLPRDALQRRITFFLARVFFRPLAARVPLFTLVKTSSVASRRRSDISSVGSVRSDIFTRVFFCDDSSSSPCRTYLPRVFLRARRASRGDCPPRSLGIETRVESDSLSGHSRQTTHLHPTRTYICSERK